MVRRRRDSRFDSSPSSSEGDGATASDYDGRRRRSDDLREMVNGDDEDVSDDGGSSGLSENSTYDSDYDDDERRRRQDRDRNPPSRGTTRRASSLSSDQTGDEEDDDVDERRNDEDDNDTPPRGPRNHRRRRERVMQQDKRGRDDDARHDHHLQQQSRRNRKKVSSISRSNKPPPSTPPAAVPVGLFLTMIGSGLAFFAALTLRLISSGVIVIPSAIMSTSSSTTTSVSLEEAIRTTTATGDRGDSRREGRKRKNAADDVYDERSHHHPVPPTTPSYTTLQDEDLGPVPDIGPPIIYHLAPPLLSPPVSSHVGGANRMNEAKEEHAEQDDSGTTTMDDMMITTEEMRNAFERDGVVAIRGLIPPDMMGRLDDASRKLVLDQSLKLERAGHHQHHGSKSGRKGGKQFYTTKVGAFLLDPPHAQPTRRTEDGHDREGRGMTTTQTSVGELSAFREVAVHSVLSRVAAEFMGLTTDQTTSTKGEGSEGHQSGSNSNKKNNITERSNVRLLRDVFLAKDDDEYICGWHVDDWGYWPATPTSPGVNAWIAIDDMPSEHGGGFAVAIGSHEASWKHEAHAATGATTTNPPQGYSSARDMVEGRVGGGTCNLRTVAPQLHRRMEDTKRIYDVKRGDIIFHTRWLFHRTVPFQREYVDSINKQSMMDPPGRREEEGETRGSDGRGSGGSHYSSSSTTSSSQLPPLLYRRYSVRYVPGTALLPPGWGMELSVMWNASNANRTIDDVVADHGPWYPQCYPNPRLDELEKMEELVRLKLPLAEERQRLRRKELQPFLQEMSRRNVLHSQHHSGGRM